MYSISDVVEMGDARELILSDIKVQLVEDDTEFNTAEPLEYFDE